MTNLGIGWIRMVKGWNNFNTNIPLNRYVYSFTGKYFTQQLDTGADDTWLPDNVCGSLESAGDAEIYTSGSINPGLILTYYANIT